MIRIYLTQGDIEGYHEGDSCGSYTDSADENDITQLIKRLNKQVDELSLLKELLEENGRDKIIYWYKVFEKRRWLLSKVEAAGKYAKDNKIQGTFYKDSFDNLATIKKDLVRVEKEYKETSSAFKKYIKLTTSD